MRFVCFRCGHRQESDTTCGSCSNDIVHDLGERSTWSHLRDIEHHLRRQRQARIIGIASVVAVILGIGLYIGLATYYGRTGQDLSRRVIRALVAVTLGVGLALVAVLERTWGQKRMFPFLDQEDEIQASSQFRRDA
jgi:hypothetical protein